MFRDALLAGCLTLAVQAQESPPKLWDLTTGVQGNYSSVAQGPDGTLYVGSSDGKLYALDARSGEKRWEYEVGDALTATPAIAAGRLVIGAQDGRIYCFG